MPRHHYTYFTLAICYSHCSRAVGEEAMIFRTEKKSKIKKKKKKYSELFFTSAKWQRWFSGQPALIGVPNIFIGLLWVCLPAAYAAFFYCVFSVVRRRKNLKFLSVNAEIFAAKDGLIRFFPPWTSKVFVRRQTHFNIVL